MKHGKRLERWMKVLLKQNKLNPDNYLYVKNQPDKLTVVNINTKITTTISK